MHLNVASDDLYQKIVQKFQLVFYQNKHGNIIYEWKGSIHEVNTVPFRCLSGEHLQLEALGSVPGSYPVFFFTFS